MTDISLPPLCPVCGGKTRLKEMHRSARAEKFTCFFRCVDCGTEYPQSIEAEQAERSGFVPSAVKAKPDDRERDPAQ